MHQSFSIVLLTGNEARHQYVANRLKESMAIAGVVSEAKAAAVPRRDLLSSEERAIIAKHFLERDHAEEHFLPTRDAFSGLDVLSVPSGSINSPDVFGWVQVKKPDYILLYGTGLIKAPLLEFYHDRMINLHLGLSPYYRGSGTNFWPLVCVEPECVGATIHLAVEQVDAGGILAQVRPKPDTQDRIHDLGCKTIIAAVEALSQALVQYAEGALRPVSQDLTTGRVFRKKDFNAAAVRRAWEYLDQGMIREFMLDRERRCGRFPIRELTSVTA